MSRRLITLAALFPTAALLHAAPAAAQTHAASPLTATPAQDETRAAAEAATPMIVVPRARRTLNSITYDEVRGTQVPDAYQLIQNLRPSWLRTPRGPTSVYNHIDVAVFKDGVRLGSREALSSIPVIAIRTLRYYSAVEARQRFGGQTGTGAIEILSR
ncbi:MAG TPA: hypothetical protein VFS20_26950 [Longimicrobium sp.]|nr:hypothetical protein [Longimicrobium sp.]